MAGVCGEDSVIPQQMASRSRHEGRQAREKVDDIDHVLDQLVAACQMPRGKPQSLPLDLGRACQWRQG